MAEIRTEFSKGWRTLLAAVAGVACGASPLPFNTIGFVMGPIHKEFGWSFAQISASVMFYGVVAALLAPVFGYLTDRFGVRRVAMLSMFAFGLLFASIGAVPNSLPVYYALWLAIGLVGIGSTPVTFSRAVNLWFVNNRGLALGIMLIGTSITALTVPKLAVWAIDEHGWRAMYPIVAALPLLIALPLGLLWLREPVLAKTDSAGHPSLELSGVTLKSALRDRRFWTIWLSIALVAFAYGGAHVHMPEIVKQHGFTVANSVAVMGLLGVASLSGRIVTGMLLDRIWAPLVGFPLLTLPAISCWLLIGTATDTNGIYFAAALLGFAAGAESDLIAYLASRYFGMRQYGQIYGLLYLPFGLCSALSPVFYGKVRDLTGNYDLMLTVSAGLFLLGAVLLATIGRYPVFDKPAAQD